MSKEQRCEKKKEMGLYRYDAVLGIGNRWIQDGGGG